METSNWYWPRVWTAPSNKNQSKLGYENPQSRISNRRKHVVKTGPFSKYQLNIHYRFD